MIYLDNAATSLIKPPRVEQAVIKAMRTMSSPGRGAYMPAMRAAETLYECRAMAAEMFNVPKLENVVFTMNATHGLNLAIKNLARKGSRVLISGFEHNSVFRPLVAAGAEIKICGRKLFDPEDTLKAFSENIKDAELVVCTHVSNVFGYILPVYDIAELCRRNNVPLVVDASQSAGVLDVDFRRLDAEFVAMPGHKALFGPQGTGLLLCKDDCMPLMEGGSGTDSISRYMPEFLPDRLEAGTHNVCGIAGLKAGMEFVKEKGTETILRHEKNLAEMFCDMLEGTALQIYRGGQDLQTGVISLSLKSGDNEAFSQKLYDNGICVRSGLHCAPLAHESAGTLEKGTVRFSFSPFFSETQLLYVCRILKDLDE